MLEVEMATLRSFEELRCWQAGRRLRMFVQGLLARMPKEEAFLMVSQLKRASRSVTHNIAEGFGRENAQDNLRFCRVSRGSLMEVLDQLITCADEGLITPEELREGRDLFTETRALLEGYMEYLGKAKSDNQLREESATYGAVDLQGLLEAVTSNSSTYNPQHTPG